MIIIDYSDQYCLQSLHKLWLKAVITSCCLRKSFPGPALWHNDTVCSVGVSNFYRRNQEMKCKMITQWVILSNICIYVGVYICVYLRTHTHTHSFFSSTILTVYWKLLCIYFFWTQARNHTTDIVVGITQCVYVHFILF